VTAFTDAAQLEESGFWFVHDELHTMMKIPNGYLVATIGNRDVRAGHGSSGLRWSVLNSKCRQSCEIALSLVHQSIETYPELKTAGEYTSWADCLSKFLIPQAEPMAALASASLPSASLPPGALASAQVQSFGF